MMPGLRRANAVVGVIHLAQAAAIAALSNGFAIPVLVAFQGGPPGTPLPAEQRVFSVSYGAGVVVFLLLAAGDHLLVAAPRLVNWYEANLRRGINYVRWAEYSISASVMIVLIAMLTGIVGLYALLGLVAVNASMIGFGLLMERTNQDRDTVVWLPFGLGCVAGTVPWVAMAIAFGGAVQEGSGPPGFVFAIFASLFIFFNCFALNQYLHYRRIGRWRDYLFAERGYLILSLLAKSALAWQVFAGTLA